MHSPRAGSSGSSGSDRTFDQVSPEDSGTADESVYQELRRLNEEYESLESTTKKLMQALEQLKKDEQCLQTGIEVLSERQQLPKSSKIQEEEAIRRLQDALMNDSSSESDDGSSGHSLDMVM